ncbi:hypothetical protein [Methanoplanus limicola]|uniref:DUF3566 domain-containing protein n=1 Tax=Methanoplanus limicola DSM 2279 TaxID=937775 RepID=H1YY69_9EURY|nr:hypothetical protein [Methanoplanus limicola]EHQ34164.1 hypothetical protein Metlim_0011 [Methanoplanus limicola DSM 2279]
MTVIKEVELLGFDVWQLSKICLLISLIMGFIISLIIGIFTFLGIILPPSFFVTLSGSEWTVADIIANSVLFSVFSGMFGLGIGALSVIVYNMLSGYFGGVMLYTFEEELPDDILNEGSSDKESSNEMIGYE